MTSRTLHGDGSFPISQICERSLAAGQGIQEIPIMPGFVRAEMLTSGLLIRPYEQGGSMVMVIDDLSFKVHMFFLQVYHFSFEGISFEYV